MATAGTITTPFGFDSTAAEVAEGIDLSGKRAVVTGAAAGIGVETARTLAAAGAGVTLAVRDLDAGASVAADITASTGNADVAVAKLELTDCATIDAFVESWEGPLDLLINNAGVMAIKSSSSHLRATRCSSPPTTSGISPSRSACTTSSPRPGTHGSSR